MQAPYYSFLDKYLHQLALNNSYFAKFTFDLERVLFRKKILKTDNKAIFVTGLARAGTTALTTVLEKQFIYHSLTYRHMPFVLMPNIWHRVSTIFKNKVVEFERSHGDGIYVSLESPEMIEEIFWKFFSNSTYIKSDRLVIHNINEELAENYIEYIKLILLSAASENNIRYLSKNNNHVLRWGDIQKILPDALFLIVFRDPVQHAFSLLSQHKRQTTKQENDPFVLNYMNWLGHYEFGKGHKPFYLGDQLLFDKMLTYSRENINYWLLNWLQYYQYALANHPSNSIFICHETYCENPAIVFQAISSATNVDFNHLPLQRKIDPKQVSNTDEDLVKQCKQVYVNLFSLTVKNPPNRQLYII